MPPLVSQQGGQAFVFHLKLSARLFPIERDEEVRAVRRMVLRSSCVRSGSMEMTIDGLVDVSD